MEISRTKSEKLLKRPEQSYKRTDVFLTHTWRDDLEGRNTHDRVRLVNQHLNHLGFTTWFDEFRMEGEIEAKMAEGVDFTGCVVVFVTEQYMLKIEKEGDNCRFEFDRAMKQKTEKHILCIVMEKKYDNPSNWFGKMKECLGGCLFVSMSGNVNDEVYFKKKMDAVVDQLKSKGVVPSQMKTKCTDCMVARKNGDREALHLDGEYCIYCSKDLQKTTEAKHYCSKCNRHGNGIYCCFCKTNLLDKEKEIVEHGEQFLKMLALESRANTDNFNIVEVEHTIKSLKVEIQELNRKRTEARKNGEGFKLSEEEYKSKIEMLEKSMESVMEDAITLTASAEESSTLMEYEEKLKDLQQTMDALSVKRRAINQRSNNVTQASEGLQQIRKQFSDMKEEAMLGRKSFTHDKYCDCSECVFERNLTSQMITNGPSYLQTLIAENKVEDLRMAIAMKQEILVLKGDDGFNLLLSLALKHTMIEMVRIVFDAGIKVGLGNSLKETILHIFTDLQYVQQVVTSNNIDWMKFVFELNDNIVDLEDYDGLNMLLSLTVKYGTLEMFDLLSSKGCRVDTISDKGQTLLHIVKNVDIGRMICKEYGEKLLTIKNNDDLTPAGVAYMSNHNPLWEVLTKYGQPSDDDIPPLKDRGIRYIEELIGKDDLATMRTILTHNKDVVHMKNREGCTPLLHCCKLGGFAMFLILVQHGSDVNARDKDGDTALLLVVRYNCKKDELDIVRWLCEHHPHLVTVVGSLQRNVFHTAVEQVRESAVAILLQCSPPPSMITDMKDADWGKTPLRNAKRNKLNKMVSMFKDYVKQYKQYKADFLTNTTLVDHYESRQLSNDPLIGCDVKSSSA